MIDKAISFFETEINQYIRNRYSTLGEDPIVPTIIADQAGTVGLPATKVSLSVVNIEEERMIKKQLPYEPSPGSGAIKRRNPEIQLNLFLLFAANLDVSGGAGATSSNYKEALKRISDVIGFFQATSIFTTETHPLLDVTIKRLTAELYTLPIEQQNYLWAALGAKYLPSVIYKIRLVSIQEGLLLGSDEPITTIDTQLAHK